MLRENFHKSHKTVRSDASQDVPPTMQLEENAVRQPKFSLKVGEFFAKQKVDVPQDVTDDGTACKDISKSLLFRAFTPSSK